MAVFKVFEHVGGVSPFRRHFLVADFANRESVTHHRALCIFQVAKMLPHRGCDVLRGWVKIERFGIPLGSPGSDHLLHTERRGWQHSGYVLNNRKTTG